MKAQTSKPTAQSRKPKGRTDPRALPPIVNRQSSIVNLQSSLPHFDQYFGCWAMHEPTFRAAVSQVERMDLVAHVAGNEGQGKPKAQNPKPETIADAQAPSSTPDPRSYLLTDAGVAVITVVGTMTKFGSSLVSGPATVALRRALRNAVQADEVRGILLLIDSPGGMTAGTSDLADDVAAAARKKPIVAYIEDMGASAAYWIAAQTQRIFASPAALIGSIGTYGVVRDSSAADAAQGIKTWVIRAGALKGAGTPGTEISDEQRIDMQRMVNEINDLFLAAVGRGRGLDAERVAELADGRAHIGENARVLGLVDEIATFDVALEALAALAKPTAQNPKPKGGQDARPNLQSSIVNRQSSLSEGENTMAETTPPDDEQKKKEDEKAQETPAEEEKKKEDEQSQETPPEDEEKKKEEEEPAAGQKAATAPELKAALPQADDGYILSCLTAGLTVAAAATMWAARPDQTKGKLPGGPGLDDKVSKPGGAPRDADHARAQELMATRDDHEFVRAAKTVARDEGLSLHDAKSRVATEQPEVYAAYRDSFRS